MTDLYPQTALGADTPRHARIAALTLSEVPDLALASVALLRGGAVPKPFGIMLPPAGKFHQDGAHFAFWTGPSSWIVGTDQSAGHDFAAAVQLASPACAVCDQTDAWTGFDLVGDTGDAATLQMMEKMINIDKARLVPGHALRCVFDHMPIFALRRAPNRLTILGMRSAAGSLWDALARTAALQFSGPAH